MLEEKQRQFWNLHWIRHKEPQSDFQALILFIAGQRYKKAYSWKYRKKKSNKNKTKIENRFVSLCAEFNSDLKNCFFFLALIVFFLEYHTEIPKIFMKKIEL